VTPKRLARILTLAAVIAVVPVLPALVTGTRSPQSAAVAADRPIARPEIAPRPSGSSPDAAASSLKPAQVRHRTATRLLSGRGMWIWEFDTVEGGDPEAIVSRAKAEGLSYVLVRAGSSRMGFYAQSHLDAILPVAHANGLKVLVWDFPYLVHPEADAERVAAELAYTTPDGHRVDGLAPDVEEPAQGVTLTRDRAERFARRLRKLAGPEAIIVMCTPRPSPPRLANYPYAEMAPFVDAWAPMIYWGFDGPEVDTELAIERLGAYGHPVAPVGRAYDMRPEGGPAQPPASETLAFLETAKRYGAPGVSFWSWQHASDETWATIRRFDW
jgi:hypothetical protein